MRRTFVVALACALTLPAAVGHAATGSPIDDFGAEGVLADDLLDATFDVTTDADGRIIVAGIRSGNIAVARLLPDGQPDVSFSADGVATFPIGNFKTGYMATIADVRALADGSIVLIGGREDNGIPWSTWFFAIKVNEGGAGATDYGLLHEGVSVHSTTNTPLGAHGAIASDGSAVLAYGGFRAYVATIAPDGRFTRRDLPAPPVPPGCLAQGLGSVSGVAALSADEFAVAASVPLSGCDAIQAVTVVTKVSLSGAATSWSRVVLPAEVAATPARQNQMSAIGSDLLLATTEGDDTDIHRFALDDGAPVAGWGEHGRTRVPDFGPIGAMAPQRGGRLAIVNGAIGAEDILVDQLAANGADDPNFVRVTVHGTDVKRTGITIAPDGDLVVVADDSSAPTLRRYSGVREDIEFIDPVRLLDTRAEGRTADQRFQGIGRVPAGVSTSVRIAGRGGVPSDAKAALLNLTMVAPSAPGYATVYPCTPEPPTTSDVNYTAGAFVANNVTAMLDADGDVCVFTVADADVLIDVAGFVPAAAAVSTIIPARLVDTRVGEPTIDGELEGLGRRPGSRTLRLAGRAGIPVGATAVVLNLTVINPSRAGYATVYPCTEGLALASTVNYARGTVVANSVIAPLDQMGDICVFTLAPSDYAVDVGAYVSVGAALESLAPARIVDTRRGQATVDGRDAAQGRIGAGSVVKVRAAGRGGVPLGATAIIANVAAVSPSSAGFLTIYPCTATPPSTSNVNYTARTDVANGVIAKVDAAGDVCIYTLAETDIILDVNGYLP